MGIDILDLIESFLVRRAVCGHEPTGLHAVFKRLWKDCEQNMDLASVQAAIEKHKTVAWPSDDEFKSAIKRRSLYGSAITKFLLLEYDKSLGGDFDDANVWIEHILPDTLSKEWEMDFSIENHESVKDTLANLIPLSEEMNRSLSNSSFKKKRERYLTDSAFKSAREVGKNNDTWLVENIQERGKGLANWALQRWIH